MERCIDEIFITQRGGRGKHEVDLHIAPPFVMPFRRALDARLLICTSSFSTRKADQECSASTAEWLARWLVSPYRYATQGKQTFKVSHSQVK